MEFSPNALQKFALYQDRLDECFAYIIRLQKVRGIRKLIKNRIKSKEELYQAYLEYLWLIERLRHPQDRAFFKDYYLPVNGYLQAYFNLELQEPVLFETSYCAINIDGNIDWRAVYVVRDGAELQRVLSPGFDFKQHYSHCWTVEFFHGIGAIAEGFVERLRSGKLASTLKKGDCRVEEQEIQLIISEGKISLSPVSTVITAILPESQHQLKLDEFWSEHFEGLYLFELFDSTLIPLITDVNNLLYTAQFLGIQSDTRFSGEWRSKDYGSLKFAYQDKTFSLWDFPPTFPAILQERLAAL